MDTRDRGYRDSWKPPVLVALLATLFFGQLASATPRLTFEDRVRAQETIERVYYSHRLETTRPFEQAVTRELLEQKVRDYLDRNVALERFRHQPVTAEALHREMERIARQTKMPERLVELYDALGNDPLLIQECVARPTLVRRLTDDLFPLDQRPHAGRRDESGAPRALAGRRQTDRRERTTKSWAEWWNDVRRDVDTTVTAVEPPSSLALPQPARRRSTIEPDPDDGPRENPYTNGPDDVWDNGVLDDFVEASDPTTVWTGSEMIVWGGLLETQGVDSGARYDPLLGVWSRTTQKNAPQPRYGHSAVWTGSEMIVWGGRISDYTFSNTGGRYDPVQDTWKPVNLDDAPQGRLGHTAVWTGDDMIVWGGGTYGTALATGGRYDPSLDRWSELPLAGAPEARNGFTAVWTGDEMIVWGGRTSYPSVYLDTGAAYDPVSDRWRATSTSVGTPTPRAAHTAVWTGTEMIVWGGSGSGASWLASGSRYDPATDAWQAVNTWPASPRSDHVAVWTGSEMLVFGWPVRAGEAYDPVRDRWRTMSEVDDPPRSLAETAVWTGGEMIVWGRGWGWRYRPGADTWLPVPSPGGVEGRFDHTAVWTGSEMIVWGGRWSDTVPDHLGSNSGARYDPLLDNWTATSLDQAPLARHSHVAVWTGDEMIVWGGYNTSGPGGRYEPLSDSWRPMSPTGDLEDRWWATAVWTGSEMIVWGGGGDGALSTNTGLRYHPATDTWRDVSVGGAPVERRRHAAVWTGDEMIVWGGETFSPFRATLNSGGRYDPQTDRWESTTIRDAPEGGLRTAVWTGSEMIVWGGGPGALAGTGGHYDPATDRWSTTGVVGAPYNRRGHSAIWTGDEMIVWGGESLISDDGGRYDPVVKSWRPTSRVDAARPRTGHTAVWSGREMIVWGGRASSGAVGGFYSGGSYLASRRVEPRGAGFWKHQCSDHGFQQVDPEELVDLFSEVNSRSRAFGECSPSAGCAVLQPDNGGQMRAKTERHLLTLWLNVVSGRVAEDVPVDLSGLSEASTVGEAIADVEDVLCNPLAARSDLERAKDVAESLNDVEDDMELAMRVESPSLVNRGERVTLTLGLVNFGQRPRTYEVHALAERPVSLTPQLIETLAGGAVVEITAEIDVPLDGGAYLPIRFVATDVTGTDGPRRELQVVLKPRGAGAGSSPPLREIQR